MRTAMRIKSYLSKPQQNRGFYSLEGKELNPQLANIINIAKSQRQEDVLNVIRYNDFSAGYNTNSYLKVLKNEAEDKLGINFETQLDILITSEQNPELRENLREYCSEARKKSDFDEEKCVEDILCNRFSYI